MKFRKVLIFVSAVFLFASCDFLNLRESFVHDSSETKEGTGKVVINIGGTNARMIRPENSFMLNDYFDWHVYFYGVMNFDFEFETLKESFELPAGYYNVLVTAVIKEEGKEGGYLITSSIQGKSEVEVVAGETASVCNILMERTKTENGTGSFEYKFKISKLSFFDFGVKYNPEDPDKVIDFTPIDYIKASLNGLTVSEKYVFDADRSDDIYVDIVSAYSEEDDFFVFTLNGVNIKSGFYRLKIDFETSNNTFIDSFDNVTEFYTKALFEYPESLVEITDNGITHLDDTENDKIYYEEFHLDHPIKLNQLSKLLRTCDKNDERVLELPLFEKDDSSFYFPLEKLNNIIKKNGIKVDLTVSDTINDTDSLSENPYLYGVTFDYLGDLKIQNDFFKDCVNLKYVRFDMDLDYEYTSLTFEENAFSGCGEITFEVPGVSLDSYKNIFTNYFDGVEFKIEAIEDFYNMFRTEFDDSEENE